MRSVRDRAQDRPRRCVGEAGLVDVVICFPMLLLVIWLAVAVGVWGLAAHAAQLAAAEGGAAARAEAASTNAGQVEATKVLSVMGPQVVNPVVSVTPAPGGLLSVSVTGRAPMVFPGLSLRVSATSTGPVQSFAGVSR